MPVCRLDQTLILGAHYWAPDGITERQNNGPVSWLPEQSTTGSLSPNESGPQATFSPSNVGFMSIVAKGTTQTGREVQDVILVEVTPGHATQVTISPEGTTTIDSTKLGTEIPYEFTITATFLDAQGRPAAIEQQINWEQTGETGVAFSSTGVMNEHGNSITVQLVKDANGASTFTVSVNNRLSGDTGEGTVLTASCTVNLVNDGDTILRIDVESVVSNT